jgi:hypothetical protein
VVVGPYISGMSTTFGWAFSNVKREMTLVLSVSVNILPSQRTRKDLISTIRIERGPFAYLQIGVSSLLLLYSR